jgi:hypothetical protein
MSAMLKNLKFAWDYFILGRHRSADGAAWIAPCALESQLWFGSLLVADLHQMSPHQDTWFSDCDLRIRSHQGELQEKLLAYIAFCEEFNRRIGEGRDHDFNEFDRFASIPNCKSWSAKLPNGRLVPMEGRIWFADGGVNWQHPEAESSTEAAANEFWMQNAPDSNTNHAKAEQDGRGQPATRPESK